MTLLRRPLGETGKIHDVSAAEAGWRFVGFSVYRLQPGEVAKEPTGTDEVIVVMVEGHAKISGGGQDF